MSKAKSMLYPPEKEGEYLFYYGNAERPFWKINEILHIDKETGRFCFAENYDTIPTLWMEFPECSKNTMQKDRLKKGIRGVLKTALTCTNDDYRDADGFIRWNKVEKAIYALIDDEFKQG